MAKRTSPLVTFGCVAAFAAAGSGCLTSDPPATGTVGTDAAAPVDVDGDVVVGHAWQGDTYLGYGPIPVHRVLNAIASLCYDELVDSDPKTAMCATTTLTGRPATAADGACEYDLCAQQMSLCIAYRSLEAGEAIGDFETRAYPLAYTTPTADPQRPGYYTFDWTPDGMGPGTGFYRREQFPLRIKLPPQATEDRTLLYEVALEYFKQAIIASGQAIETDCIDGTGVFLRDEPDAGAGGSPSLLPSSKEIFLVSFHEAAVRLDETLGKITEHEVAVGSANGATASGEAKRSWSAMEGAEWNAPVNSRFSGALRVFGRTLTGGGATDLGSCTVRLDAEGARIALDLLRASRIGYWEPIYEDTAMLGADVINALREDRGETAVEAADAPELLGAMGTSIPELAAARQHLIEERRTFHRVNPDALDPFPSSGGRAVPRYFGVATFPSHLPSGFLGGRLGSAMETHASPLRITDPDYAGRSVLAAMAFAGDAAQRLLTAPGALSDTQRRMMQNLQVLTDAAAGVVRVRAKFTPDGMGRFSVVVDLIGDLPAGSTFVLVADPPDPARETEGLRCWLAGSIEGKPCDRADYVLPPVAGSYTETDAPEVRDGWKWDSLTVQDVEPSRMLHAFLKREIALPEFVSSLVVPSEDRSVVVVVPAGGNYEHAAVDWTRRVRGGCSEAEKECIGLDGRLVPPLENELTEDSDPYENSWRHYLDAAENAAAVADALGEQVIDYGLQMDMRAEQAEMQAATLCGDTGDVGWGDIGPDTSATEAQAACTGDDEQVLDYVSIGGPLCLYVHDTEGSCRCPTDVTTAPCGMECPAQLRALPASTTPADACAKVYGFDSALDAPAGFTFAYTGEGGALNLFDAAPEDDNSDDGAVADCADLRALRCRYEEENHLSPERRSCSPEEIDAYVTGAGEGKPTLREAAETLRSQRWFGYSNARGLAETLKYKEDFLYHATLSAGPDVLWTTKVTRADACPRPQPFRYRYRSGIPDETSPSTPIRCYTPLPDPGTNDRIVDFLRNDLIATPGGTASPASERMRWARRLLRTVYALSYMTAGGPTVLQSYRHARAGWYESWVIPQGETPFWLANLKLAGSDEESYCKDGTCYCNALCSWTDTEWDDPASALRVFCADGLVPCMDRSIPCPWGSVTDPTNPNRWLLYELNARHGNEQAGFADCGYQSDHYEETGRRAYLNTRDNSPRLDGGFAAGQRRLLENWWTDYVVPVMAAERNDADPPEGRAIYWADMLSHGALGNQFRSAMLDSFSAEPIIASEGVCSADPETDWFCVDAPFDPCLYDVVPSPDCGTLEAVSPVDASFHIRPEDGYDALELLCHVASRGVGCAALNRVDMPPITSINDLPMLSRYIACKGATIADQVRRLALPNVPPSVVDAVRRGPGVGDYPGAAGKRRESLMAIAGSLRDLRDASERAQSALTQMSASVDAYYNDVQAQNWRTELESLNIWEQATLTMLNAVDVDPKAVLFGGGVRLDIVAAARAFATEKDAALTRAHEYEVAARTARFMQEMVDHGTRLNEEVSAIFRGYEAARAGINAYQDLQREASIWFAQARLEVSDEADSVYRVNEVYRKRLNTARVRYDDALEAARKLAFIARRAIEFRLGVDMSRMHADLPLVPAPSTWYRQVCDMHGIDYAEVSGANRVGTAEAGADAGADATTDATTDAGGEAGASAAAWNEDYAGGYIGDYVRRLGNFVESYNIEFPFTDAEDVAVLSLRDDLFQTRAVCSRDSYNLLLFSDDLGRLDEQAFEDGSVERTGWLAAGCREFEASSPPGAACIERIADDPASTCGSNPGDDCTGAWRFSADGTAVQGRAGLAERVRNVCRGMPVRRDGGGWDYPEPGPGSCPPGSFTAYYSQTVTGLRTAARYLLSWYVALPTVERNPSARVPAIAYKIQVVDASAGGSYGDVLAEYAETASTTWRRVGIFFETETDGPDAVEVRVFPSTTGALRGEIWLRSLQLEETALPCADPGACGLRARTYESVEGSRFLSRAACPDLTGEAFRRGFDRKCMCTGERHAVCNPGARNADPDRCFYEAAFGLTLSEIEAGRLIPSASVAVENFNYRHGTVALNFVGTNTRACLLDSPDMCYSNGFLPYSLAHAGNVAVRNHDWDIEWFRMNPGRIEHGKALAAELFVSNPPTATHESLLAPYTNAEMRGRPLTGGYILRIWDVPELNWTAVEDTQMIWRYQYWTSLRDGG